MKTDYYELLGIDQNASDTDIKKAYRKNALKYHPDKNPNNIEECTRIFAEIKAAHEVLSDPQERAWYDSHKNQILHQGSGAGGDGDEANVPDEAGITVPELLRFFDPTLYQRYDDSVAGFYQVAGRVFEVLAAEEVTSGKAQSLKEFLFYNDDVEGYVGEDLLFPVFGSSHSDYEKVVRKFYAGWSNFSTVKSFFWKDNYMYSSTMDRRTRRAIEKMNKKTRDGAKKDYNETVRSFVSFIKKRDPRVKRGAEALEIKRKEKLQQDLQRQIEIQKQERKKMRINENFELQDWQRYDPEELEEIERNFSSPSVTSEDEKEDEEGKMDKEERVSYNEKDNSFAREDHNEGDPLEFYECVVCDKAFKSEKQFQAHELSRKHKKEVNRLKWQMKKEGIALGLDDDGISNDVSDDLDNDDSFLTASENELDNIENEHLQASAEHVKDLEEEVPPAETASTPNDNIDQQGTGPEIIDNDIDELDLPQNSTTSSFTSSAKKSKKQKKKNKNKKISTPQPTAESDDNNNGKDNELKKLSEALEKGIALDSDDDDGWLNSSSSKKRKKGKGRRKK